MEVNIMVAATYGDYHFTGINASLARNENTMDKNDRYHIIEQETNVLALIKGRKVGITGRRPAGMKNRAEFIEFVNEHGGEFVSPAHYDSDTIVFGDKNSPSAKMVKAKEVGAIIFPVDRL